MYNIICDITDCPKVFSQNLEGFKLYFFTILKSKIRYSVLKFKLNKFYNVFKLRVF